MAARTRLNDTLCVHRLSGYKINVKCKINKINVKLLSRFLLRIRISPHPYVIILKVITLHVAVLAFPLCPKLKQLLVL